MIVNGFGNGSSVIIPPSSTNLLYSASTTITQTETISGKTNWPGGGATTTEYSSNYLLARLDAAYTPLNSVIVGLLQKYRSLLLELVVTSITPPAVSFTGNFTGGTTTANNWPFRISVATGLGNTSYNFLKCYYRDCTQSVPVPFSAGTLTFTINAANYGALSILDTQAVTHTIDCIGYGGTVDSYAYSASYGTGGMGELESSTSPKFFCMKQNYGGLYICINKSMSTATSSHAPTNPTSFNASGASATLVTNIYGS